MATLVTTRHHAHAFSAFVVLVSIALQSVTSVTPTTLAGPAAAGLPQPAHPGSHGDRTEGGLDSFQTGMIVGFVTFAVLALFMMILILYFLVRGTRRELRKTQVELSELREQRRQEMAAERFQIKGRASELRCMVDEDDDSSDLVKDENERDCDAGYDYQSLNQPSYDNYSYVAMETQRNGQYGRKKQKANDFIIEN